MDPRYRYELLPLDTQDDDPRWAAYVNIFRTVFLEGRVAPEGVDTFRKHRREDGALLGMVTTEGPGLDGRQPVAAFNSTPTTINTGRGLSPALIVNTVGVLPSHRRKGVLKEMMRRQLDAARDAGRSIAVLTASEATIYGRFGFGPATRAIDIRVDTRRFGFHAGAAPEPGAIEFVEPSFLDDHWERITTAHQERHRGAVGHTHAHFLIDTGAWDQEAGAPSKTLRAVVHFDAAEQPDGFALFQFKGWDETPKASVSKVCAADPSVERALWQALAQMDLIATLTYSSITPDSPLLSSLADSRAVKVTGMEDWVWLRILDLPAAVEARAFDADGEVSIAVDDAQGYIAGSWHLRVVDGIGSVEAITGEPEVRLSADTLSTLWLGDRGAVQASEAGLVQGAREAVGRLGRLLRWDEPAENLAGF